MKTARMGEIDELGPLVQKDRNTFSNVDERISPIVGREPRSIAAVVDLHEAVAMPRVAEPTRIEEQSCTRLAADDSRDERRIDAVLSRDSEDRSLEDAHRVLMRARFAV